MQDEMKEITLRDRRTWPFVMISKRFYALKPSWREILTYNALVYYAGNQSRSCERIPIRTMAALANTSEDTIKRGLAELEKKKIIRIKHRSKKSSSGHRIPEPSLYELLDLEPLVREEDKF